MTREANERFSAAVAVLDEQTIAPLLDILQLLGHTSERENHEEDIYRACPEHGMHSLKTAGCCTFVSEISGVVPGQTWLWADDEETVAAFDDAACALLKRLPSKLRNQLMLYTASLTIIPHSVHEDASKWHVDWYGIPDALSWTMLVPLWPRDDDDWRALGGTQLCLKEHALPRADSVAPSIAAVAALVAKEAAEQNPNECPEHWASADFSVVEHSYQRGECLLFEGHVLHRTGPYQAENPATRVLASLMVGPRDPRHWPEVSRSLCKQGACFVRKPDRKSVV